jgi:hypothetical protein
MSTEYRPPDEYRDSLERLFFQMDNMFHNRVGHLLLAEAIFFAGASELADQPVLLLIITALGIVSTLLFWFTNLKLSFRVTWLLTQFKKLDTVYVEYLHLTGLTEKEVGKVNAWVLRQINHDGMPYVLSTAFLYAWGIPLLCLCGWLCFGIYALWSL